MFNRVASELKLEPNRLLIDLQTRDPGQLRSFMQNLNTFAEKHRDGNCDTKNQGYSGKRETPAQIVDTIDDLVRQYQAMS